MGFSIFTNPLVVSSAKTLVHLLIIALITHNLPLVYLQTSLYIWTSLVAQTVKRLLTMQETRVQSLGWEDPLVLSGVISPLISSSILGTY